MKIVIGNDHSALELKKELVAYIESLGHEVINLGTDNLESVDYPYYGYRLSKMVVNKEADLGIGICGTGIGISLACNKVKGIRACVCSEPYTSKLSRAHNNANVLCLGARVVGSELAKMIVENFINTEFEGLRHARRVNLIQEIENSENSETEALDCFGGCACAK